MLAVTWRVQYFIYLRIFGEKNLQPDTQAAYDKTKIILRISSHLKWLRANVLTQMQTTTILIQYT